MQNERRIWSIKNTQKSFIRQKARVTPEKNTLVIVSIQRIVACINISMSILLNCQTIDAYIAFEHEYFEEFTQVFFLFS